MDPIQPLLFEYLFNLILEGEGGASFLSSSSLYFTC